MHLLSRIFFVNELDWIREVPMSRYNLDGWIFGMSR